MHEGSNRQFIILNSHIQTVDRSLIFAYIEILKNSGYRIRGRKYI